MDQNSHKPTSIHEDCDLENQKEINLVSRRVASNKYQASRAKLKNNDRKKNFIHPHWNSNQKKNDKLIG